MYLRETGWFDSTATTNLFELKDVFTEIEKLPQHNTQNKCDTANYETRPSSR